LESTAVQLGFVTIVHDSQGYCGAYLATNAWGRPLEFRLTTSVQPTKVQRLLYGTTLRGYVCADLLGKSLLEKSTTLPSLVVTDCDAVLELRPQVAIPIVWLAPLDHHQVPLMESAGGLITKTAAYAMSCHAAFSQEAAEIKKILTAADIVDLAEPLARVREALAEAKKFREPSKAA
jgi:hypothetical protein